MGKHFGELAKVRGIVQFRLSPHEQRAFAGAISQGLPNIFRRIRSEIFFVAPRKFPTPIYLFLSSGLVKNLLVDVLNIIVTFYAGLCNTL